MQFSLTRHGKRSASREVPFLLIACCCGSRRDGVLAMVREKRNQLCDLLALPRPTLKVRLAAAIMYVFTMKAVLHCLLYSNCRPRHPQQARNQKLWMNLQAIEVRDTMRHSNWTAGLAWRLCSCSCRSCGQSWLLAENYSEVI